MALFDDFERCETRYKNQRESEFSYLNTSARSIASAAREVLENWFERYPGGGKTDLRARFRSPINSQHQSAFFELYLHELFLNMGFTLEVHPELENAPSHPDYLVLVDGVPKFYLEATLAGIPSSKEVGAQARLAEVLDLINTMRLPGYFIEVIHSGIPKTPPPTRDLRAKLERWINELDIEHVRRLCTERRFEELPTLDWEYEGLSLSFRPVPRSEEHRLRTDVRPIGITMGEPKYLNVAQEIRDALGGKAQKYGDLNLPLVVAVLVTSDFYDRSDLIDAVFGDEVTVVSMDVNGRARSEPGERKGNGVWFVSEPRNTNLCAVLASPNLNIYSAATTTPLLIHNPYAQMPLAPDHYPLPQLVPNMAENKMEEREGRRARDILQLPCPWPPNETGSNTGRHSGRN